MVELKILPNYYFYRPTNHLRYGWWRYVAIIEIGNGSFYGAIKIHDGTIGYSDVSHQKVIDTLEKLIIDDYLLELDD